MLPAGGKTAQQVGGTLRAELARVTREASKTRRPASEPVDRLHPCTSAVPCRDRRRNWAATGLPGLSAGCRRRLLALLRTSPPKKSRPWLPSTGDDQLTIATLLPQPLEGARKRPRPLRARRTGPGRHMIAIKKVAAGMRLRWSILCSICLGAAPIPHWTEPAAPGVAGGKPVIPMVVVGVDFDGGSRPRPTEKSGLASAVAADQGRQDVKAVKRGRAPAATDERPGRSLGRPGRWL